MSDKKIEKKTCQNCQLEKENLMRCAQCKQIYYCSKECQKNDWQNHKQDCKPQKPKQKIDDYEIKEIIGEGNFTQIFKAFHKPNQNYVALKIAEKKKLIKLHKEQELFVEKHCLQILSKVDDVINIYETFQDDFSLYISMEFIEGKELWDLCNVYGIINKELVHSLFYKILEAFKKLHDHDIVHRDIKPENIMIQKETQKIKIVDFGSAKDIKNNVQSKGNSSTGRKYFEHFMGTPNYMAPECINNKFSDKKCDIYSLGALLYNMITGFPPYIGGSEYLIFKQVIDQKQPKFYDFLFDQFEIEIIQSMMSFEADDRPDINEVLQRCVNWKDIDTQNIYTDNKVKFFEDLIKNFQKREIKPDKDGIKLEFEPHRQKLLKDFEQDDDFLNLRKKLKYTFQQVLHFYNIKDFEYPNIEVDQQLIQHSNNFMEQKQQKRIKLSKSCVKHRKTKIVQKVQQKQGQKQIQNYQKLNILLLDFIESLKPHCKFYGRKYFVLLKKLKKFIYCDQNISEKKLDIFTKAFKQQKLELDNKFKLIQSQLDKNEIFFKQKISDIEKRLDDQNIQNINKFKDILQQSEELKHIYKQKSTLVNDNKQDENIFQFIKNQSQQQQRVIDDLKFYNKLLLENIQDQKEQKRQFRQSYDYKQYKKTNSELSDLIQTQIFRNQKSLYDKRYLEHQINEQIYQSKDLVQKVQCLIINKYLKDILFRKITYFFIKIIKMLNQGISEFLGCLVLAFFNGILRIQVPEGYFLIALINFFLIVAFTASAKGYSARYFNPILNLVQLLIGQDNFASAFVNLICQLAGSMAGGMLIYSLHEKKNLNYEQKYYGEPLMANEEKLLSAFLEGLSMFILVLVYNLIIKSKSSPEHIESTALACVYFICICCFGYQSGGCLNLTTLIGPSIISGNLQDWGYFIYGQIIGGLVAGLFFSLLLKRKRDYFGNEDEENEKIKAN